MHNVAIRCTHWDDGAVRDVCFSVCTAKFFLDDFTIRFIELTPILKCTCECADGGVDGG